MSPAEMRAELATLDALGGRVAQTLTAEMDQCPHCHRGAGGALCSYHEGCGEDCSECGPVDEDAGEETT